MAAQVSIGDELEMIVAVELAITVVGEGAIASSEVIMISISKFQVNFFKIKHDRESMTFNMNYIHVIMNSDKNCTSGVLLFCIDNVTMLNNALWVI